LPYGSKPSGKSLLSKTSDIHGAILPYDFINDTPSRSSLASVSTYLKSLRQSGERSIVLLDGGDTLQGDPSVYYYNFVETNATHLAIRAFMSLNYDACVVGNHDIETGHAVYDRLTGQYEKFWISANITDLSNDRPYFQPYRIVKRDGIRIAILALTTPYIPHWLPENIRSGMSFEDMVVSASNWIAYLKEYEKTRPDRGTLPRGDGLELQPPKT
jgi:2',3'-cyclic-nucleotide 2'-phosphodiesterase/3'-nucleotidase